MRFMRRSTLSRCWPAAIVLAGALAGCASAPDGSKASVSIKAVYGLVPGGSMEFVQQGPDMVVYQHFSGFPTNANYGLHIHEKGECSPPTLASAGGIYNPTKQPHGPQDRDHMVGDLPNLVGDTEGLVNTRIVVRNVTVADLVGKSVIVHRYPDDYRTQPEGNSGDRIACGVIKAS
jgi:superoxide dismutase, Cu-Zn family